MCEKVIKIFTNDIYFLFCIEGKITLHKIIGKVSNEEYILFFLGSLLWKNDPIIYQNNENWCSEIDKIYKKIIIESEINFVSCSMSCSKYPICWQFFQ